MKLRTIILFAIFTFFVNDAIGQTLKAYEKKAEAAYIERNYTAALAYHHQLIEIDSNRVDALFYAGESARQIRAFAIAEKHFLNIPDSLKTGFFSTTDFRLANVKKGLEKYDEAITYYQKYIEKNPDTTNPFTNRALDELDYCEWAMEVLNQPIQTRITQLDTARINTTYIDFAPFKKDGILYYTTAFKYNEDEPAVTRVYSYDEVEEIKEIEPLGLKNNEHVSHTSYSDDGQRVFFTICKDREEYVGEYLCEIFYRDIDNAGHWRSPKKLPINVNMPDYTATQPSVATNPNGEGELLYFASDRPGGKGKLDLWVSRVTIDSILSFSSPQPLTDLNTPQDDISPYFHSSSETLFFSSEGHKTLGGFDIFKTKKELLINQETGEEELEWAAPENIGYPMNSSYDDLYYTFASQEGKAYFASNRPGSLCAAPDKGCTCTDLYEGTILVDLKTFVYNSIDSSALEETKLELINLVTGQVDTFQFNENGNLFLFPLNLETDYKIVASKEEYKSAETTFSTRGIIESTTIEERIYLIPQITLWVLTYDAVSKAPLNGTTIQLFDEATKKDSILFLPNTSNQTKFKIDFKNDYRVTGAKESYSSARDTFNTHPYSTPTVITIELYLNTFNLPLTLYFDNDKPRYVQKMDTTVTLTYGQTYERYLRRQPTFKNGYAKNLAGGAVWVAHEEIDNFFKDEVVKGWDDLQEFSGLLLPYLEEGNKIEIIVEGYASPLAPGDYNKRLTKRRISSVINQLKAWSNGTLADYLDQGFLIVKEDPKGEETAGETISDSEKDRRASVYSPKASRERRVRITDVRRQQSMMSWVEKEK